MLFSPANLLWLLVETPGLIQSDAFLASTVQHVFFATMHSLSLEFCMKTRASIMASMMMIRIFDMLCKKIVRVFPLLIAYSHQKRYALIACWISLQVNERRGRQMLTKGGNRIASSKNCFYNPLTRSLSQKTMVPSSRSKGAFFPLDKIVLLCVY